MIARCVDRLSFAGRVCFVCFDGRRWAYMDVRRRRIRCTPYESYGEVECGWCACQAAEQEGAAASPLAGSPAAVVVARHEASARVARRGTGCPGPAPCADAVGGAALIRVSLLQSSRARLSGARELKQLCSAHTLHTAEPGMKGGVSKQSNQSLDAVMVKKEKQLRWFLVLLCPTHSTLS